jgi:carboxymethylenebutenolidase
LNRAREKSKKAPSDDDGVTSNAFKEDQMTEPEGDNTTLSPQQLEQLWAEHLKGEFETKDVEETLATMVEDADVNHMPVNTGGHGKEALRIFYRDDFIPSWPDDLQMTPVNRVIGEGQLVDELHVTFTHSKQMNWFLPNVAPTHQKIELDIVVVVQFRGDKLATERIYWDHATVLRQVGLLKE